MNRLARFFADEGSYGSSLARGACLHPLRIPGVKISSSQPYSSPRLNVIDSYQPPSRTSVDALYVFPKSNRARLLRDRSESTLRLT